eukprot:CAMPEP_0168566246 /NCGR_PEP_ID=MMETSP0413-20121227/14312_1 /TAXON_ID=136452 /ORGANISM="Filamoeba nolandi, Strain NC-AS-23-1" /LENGTH=847 /DNA_ID=CAMNT_0008598243 /DNA_START=54 /DNA_END=2597 /DNA_ORIENTATION=-
MYKKTTPPPKQAPPPPPQDDSDNEAIPPETVPLPKSLSAVEQMRSIDEELAALEREEEMLRQVEKNLIPSKNAGEDSDSSIGTSDDGGASKVKKKKEPKKTMRKSSSTSSMKEEPQKSQKLAADLKELINDAEFSDIILVAQDKRIYCHKAILAARCEHFKRLFGMNKAAKEINMKEITNFSVLQSLVEYLYTGKASVKDSFVEQLLQVAKDFNLPELIKACEKKMGISGLDKARSNSVVEIDVSEDGEIPGETAKMREFRKRIALEVEETEKTYVKSLTAIFNDFVVPLRTPPEQWDKKQKHLQLLGFSGEDTKNPILTAEEVTAIFSYWEVILRCHATFLKAIEDRMAEWKQTPELGDVFLNKTAFIKLYKHYVNNFDKAIMTIKELKEKNKRFKEFLGALEFSPRLQGLGLQAFLILPVQRIPRYVLLLQDLLKHTVSAHPDFNNLHSALRTMKELADYINANKNDADEINKILALQDRLLNWPTNVSLVQPRRKLIREGTLMMGKDKYSVCLFTDAFLYCKPKTKDKLKYKGLISLPTSSLNTTPGKKDEKFDFEIIAQTGKFHFTAAPEEKESWIKILNETIEQSQKDLLSTAFSGYEKNDSEGSKQFQQLRVEENIRKRSESAAAMRDSEKEYLDSLNIAMHKFYEPIQKSTETQYPILSPADINSIFCTLPQIHKAHTNFFKNLDKRVNTWDNNTTIGDLYLELVIDIMKAYSMFFDNYPTAMETLETTMGNSIHFATFIVTNEKELKITLTSLLEKPLKRLAVYYLNLEEIQQYTLDSHPDLPHLKTVITRLREYLDQQKQNKLETIKAGGPLLRTRTNSVSKITRKGSWTSGQMASGK